MEFIFFNEQRTPLAVPDSVKSDFEFAHSELGENRTPNAEWKFWRKPLADGNRVPVFVLMGGAAVKAMGLAMMFRLPYEHSIHDAIAHVSKDHLDPSRLDLAELIMGRVEDQKGLRGRVNIETLLAEGMPERGEQVTTVLSSPKPTYYPNYVEQRTGPDGCVKQYTTFMDASCKIRGWKRFIVRPDDHEPSPPQPPSPAVATAFCPLRPGTTFHGTLHVHNLLPEELGALTWAITWGGDPKLRHSLGLGKPYGFGSVSVEITASDLRWCDPRRVEPVNLGACQGLFERCMEEFKAGWRQSDQLRALMAIANPTTAWPHEVCYPSLGQNRATNEFVNHKKRGHALLATPPAAPRQEKPERVPRAPEPHQDVSHATPADESPCDRFLREADGLSLGETANRLRRLGLDPDAVTPEQRKRIYQKLRKKPAYGNRDFERLLSAWKADL